MIFTGSNRLAPILFALLVTGPLPAFAQDQAETETAAYAAYYGDGMRHYAEGRHDEAIAHFYRAYALRPSAHLLKLIVRTHDFMGHCSAARHQLDHFEREHPKDSPPRLQICRAPGILEVACAKGVEEVVVDDTIRTRCGTSIAVPAGTHKVRSADGGPASVIVVKSGQTSEAKVEAGDSKKSFQKIPLLEDDERYIVIRSPDGLYQLWVRTPLRDDPDMKTGSGPAGFQIEQGDDGLYHITEKPRDSKTPEDEPSGSQTGASSP